MLHPDASGMKHGTRETHENHLGFVLDEIEQENAELRRGAVSLLTADRSELRGTLSVELAQATVTCRKYTQQLEHDQVRDNTRRATNRSICQGYLVSLNLLELRDFATLCDPMLQCATTLRA